MVGRTLKPLTQAQQRAFFRAQARPDGLLTTGETRLTRPQVVQLQNDWDQAFSSANVGNTAVL